MAYQPQGLFLDWSVAELEARRDQLKALFQAGGRVISAAGSGDVSVQKQHLMDPIEELAEIKYALDAQVSSRRRITRTSFRYV